MRCKRCHSEMRLKVKKNRNGNPVWHCDTCCSREHYCEHIEELPRVKEDTVKTELESNEI